MQIKLIECSICKAENWKNLDYLRDQKYWYDKDYLYDEPIGFKICQECGFVTYDYTDDEELKRRYENERKIADLNSILTTNRKLKYHEKFLYKELEAGKLHNVLDYGCGIGYFLNWIKKKYQGCQCYGVEFNDILIRYAREEFGLSVYDYIPKEEYDLICCYHTFEHLQYPFYFLFVILIAIMAGLGVWIIMSKTRIGIMLRAISMDREMARAMGIRIRKLNTLAFGMGGALAGLAGALIVPTTPALLGIGMEPLIMAFIVVVLGGLGSLKGALVGALIVGETRSIGIVFFPEIELPLLFLIAVIILVSKPKGLFGR